MCRIRKNKIEKIEEEDEGNSSMMQSYKSDDRREHDRKKSETDPTSSVKEGKSFERYDRRAGDSAAKSRNGGEAVVAGDSAGKREARTASETLDSRPEVRKRSKSNANLAADNQDSLGAAPTKDNSRTETGDASLGDKSGDTRLTAKRPGNTSWKLEASSAYKANSVSLLNMLQNKTLSLIRNVG